MSSIETNMHDAPQVTYEEAMVGRVIPVVRVGPAIVEERGPVGLGWLRDLPDFRDYTSESAPVASQLEAIGVAQPKALTLASRVDLRQYCSPIENQGALGSCTANATVGLVEYFERRAHGKFIDASRLFLYKVTRDLLHWTGDTGAYLRSTMGALALFGVPPEEYCPYDESVFDNEPSAMCFAFASNFRAIAYYRLDPAGTTPSALLDRIKANLSAGLPSVFGFTVYSSISQAAPRGDPVSDHGRQGDRRTRDADVGYDDNVTITNATSRARRRAPSSSATRGARAGATTVTGAPVQLRHEPARSRLLVADERRSGPTPAPSGRLQSESCAGRSLRPAQRVALASCGFRRRLLGSWNGGCKRVLRPPFAEARKEADHDQREALVRGGGVRGDRQVHDAARRSACDHDRHRRADHRPEPAEEHRTAGRRRTRARSGRR